MDSTAAKRGGARRRRSGGQRDSRSPSQRALDARADANRIAWAQLHPDMAAAERRLRKSNATLQARWKHKNEGTPETHEHASRRNQGALVRLYQSGAIDAEQLASAVEIAQVAERIGRDVAVKTASLETRVDVTHLGDGSFFERLGQVRREVAYTEWRQRLQQPGAVLDMLVGDEFFGAGPVQASRGPAGFTIIARKYRMHNRKAKQLLIDALDLWPEILGHACKMIDHEDLAAAHARLAA